MVVPATTGTDMDVSRFSGMSALIPGLVVISSLAPKRARLAIPLKLILTQASRFGGLGLFLALVVGDCILSFSFSHLAASLFILEIRDVHGVGGCMIPFSISSSFGDLESWFWNWSLFVGSCFLHLWWLVSPCLSDLPWWICIHGGLLLFMYQYFGLVWLYGVVSVSSSRAT